MNIFNMNIEYIQEYDCNSPTPSFSFCSTINSISEKLQFTASHSITLPSVISGWVFFNWIKNDCLEEICLTSANSFSACVGLRKKILSDVCRQEKSHCVV